MLLQSVAWFNTYAPYIIFFLFLFWLLLSLKRQLSLRKINFKSQAFFPHFFSWFTFKILKTFGWKRRLVVLFFHLGLLLVLFRHLIFFLPPHISAQFLFLIPLLRIILYLWLMLLFFLWSRRLLTKKPPPAWPLLNWFWVLNLSLTVGSGFVLNYMQDGLASSMFSYGVSFKERQIYFLNQFNVFVAVHLVLVLNLAFIWLLAPLNRHPWHK